MTKYEELLDEAEKNGLITLEIELPYSKGRIIGKNIAINSYMNETEKTSVIAEELGHYYTTVGNILDQSNSSNRKQEFRARAVAYNRLIGVMGLTSAYKAGCHNQYEIAEFLGVTVEFLVDAINFYRGKYGICAKVDNFVVYFDPLWMIELY